MRGIIVSKTRLQIEASALSLALEKIKTGRIDRALHLIEQARDMIHSDADDEPENEEAA